MTHYHYGQNTPGYMPMSDDPNIADTFDSARDALQSDVDDIAGSEEDVREGPYEGSMAESLHAASATIREWETPDTVYAASDRPHDLGLAFWISECEEEDCLIQWLQLDGGAVPCSRYGRNSADCAPVAVALARIVADATGEPMTLESVDHAMGLVVNDHDDVATLILEHGSEDDRALLDD